MAGRASEQRIARVEKDQASIQHRTAKLKEMAAGFQRDLRTRMAEFFQPGTTSSGLDARA